MDFGTSRLPHLLPLGPLAYLSEYRPDYSTSFGGKIFLAPLVVGHALVRVIYSSVGRFAL